MEKKINAAAGEAEREVMAGIRFAEKKDIPAIMEFIDRYWASGHILSRDREIFDFQYVYGDEVCFVLGEDQESGRIESVLGYIPYDTQGERDMFSAIWKVGRSAGFLQGMELIRFLERYGRCRNLYGVGLASGAVSTMKYLRKRIADFEHYYRLNPAVTDYRIAEIKTAAQICLPERENGPVQKTVYREITDYAEIAPVLARCQEGRFPRKAPEFVKRRYFEHPEYNYETLYLERDGKEALLVCRVQEEAGRSVYRIIDLIGDVSVIAGAGSLFTEKFETAGYEYADCLVCGMEEAYMNEAGFVKKTESDGNIIPNYFEPFERRNIVIHNYLPKTPGVVVFKGDGDQDRPNVRKKERKCVS